jgi:hypothetical protein
VLFASLRGCDLYHIPDARISVLHDRYNRLSVPFMSAAATRSLNSSSDVLATSVGRDKAPPFPASWPDNASNASLMLAYVLLQEQHPCHLDRRERSPEAIVLPEGSLPSVEMT